MEQDSIEGSAGPALFAGEAWFDPIESGIRGRIRGLTEELVEQELAAALGRGRYERGGTAEQHIKAGKNSVAWTRLSCTRFAANAVRLQLHALAYNRANFLRTLALAEEVKHWSLTTFRDRLVKIGAKIVRHKHSITFQMAEVMVPRGLQQQILAPIAALRPSPPPARC